MGFVPQSNLQPKSDNSTPHLMAFSGRDSFDFTVCPCAKRVDVHSRASIVSKRVSFIIFPLWKRL